MGVMPEITKYDKSQLPPSIEVAWFFESDLDSIALAKVPANIKNIGKKRAREYCASRMALQQLCPQSPPDNSFAELEIIEHSHLKKNSKLKISLSHTRGLAAAAATTQYRTIGVDIELNQRIVKSEVTKFFQQKQDIALSKLELWCIKEAAFKAFEPLQTYKTHKETLVLNDFIVTEKTIIFYGRPIAYWNCQNHDGILTALVWI